MDYANILRVILLIISTLFHITTTSVRCNSHRVYHRHLKECHHLFPGYLVDWIDMLYDVERLERAIPTKDDIDLIIGKYFDLITKMYEYFEKNRVHNGR